MVSSYTLGDPNGAGAAAGLLPSIQRDAAGRIAGYTHTNGGSPAAGFEQGFGNDAAKLLPREQGANGNSVSRCAWRKP